MAAPGAEMQPETTSEEGAGKVLAFPLLAWFLCESGFSALAGASSGLWGRLHSRECFRALAAQLPPLPAGLVPRRRLWRRLLLGAMELKGGHEYEELCEMESQADAEILRDVGRTFPERFDESTQQALFRVLRAVSHRVEDIGYCQGMNFIAGVMLCVFRSGAATRAAEAIVYHSVLSMLLRHGMNQYFGHGFPKLRLSALQFDCLLEAYLPDLSALFNRFSISAEFYATQWFLTLFAYSLPFPHVLRVWDHFLCRGVKFIHRVGLALLKEARPSLLGQSFDTTIDRLRCLCQTQLSPEALVASALQFKVTNRFLSELEAAITSPAGLPCCFLERDLDRGKTCCRFLLNPDDGTNKAPDVFGSTFLEGSLPAPRVPADPLASRLPEPKAKSKALGTTSQLKSLARKSQKVLSRASLGIRTGRSTGSKADADADLSMPLPDPVLQEKPWPARSASVPLSRGSRGEKGAWDEVQPVSPDRARSRNWMPSLRRRKASPDRRAELFGS